MFCSVYPVSLCCSVYCLCVNVYCTVLLPPGVNPISVNKYISYHIVSYHIISYHIISYHIYIYIFLSGYRDKDNCFKWITNYKETFFVGGVWFRFEVLRAVGIKITIFCDVMPCSSVETLHASKQFYILSSVSLSLFKALSEYSACVNFILLLLKLRFLLLLITVIARKLLSEKNYRPRPVSPLGY